MLFWFAKDSAATGAYIEVHMCQKDKDWIWDVNKERFMNSVQI